MVTKAEVKKWSSFRLTSELLEAISSKKAFKAREVPTEADKVALYKAELDEATKTEEILDGEMTRREKEDKEEKAKAAAPAKTGDTTTPNANTLLGIKVKAIDRAINQLEVFGPGSECFTFIRNVKNLAAFAECEPTRAYMITALYTKLAPEYQTRYNAKEKPITTVEEFTGWIAKTFQSKKSIFQYLQGLDQMARKEDESVRDYAGRIDEEMFDVKTIVYAKFLEEKKKKDPDFDKTIGPDDVFDFFAGTILLRDLQNDREAFNYTITRVDDCFGAQDVANVAAAYKERSQGTDPLLSDPIAMHVKTDRPKGDTICWHFQEHGTCRFGEKCRFKHVAPDKNQAKNNGKGGNWRRGGANKGKQESQKDNGDKRAEDKTPQVNYARTTGAQVFH